MVKNYKTTQKLINNIVNLQLCTGCGTCIGVCPNNAIILLFNEKKGIYLPKIIDDKCTSCGICYKVCPGHPFNYKVLNLEIFKKNPHNFLIGNYVNCYIGNSKNNFIRYNSSSGGLITQLLLFALEKKIIDGALVTRMKKSNPLEPEPFIARTKEEIIEASKSKYCPVPANIALKEILNSKEHEKFAIVGLPCQIHGIRKAEKFNSKLKEKIILHFGIFCSHTLSFHGTNFLFKKLGIKKREITQLDYRGEGWPGKIKIKLDNNQQKLISNDDPLWDAIFNSGLFIPIRCLLCNDLTAELADISFGDAWLQEIIRKDHIGKSIIILRSKIGKDLLCKAFSYGNIDLEEIGNEKVIESQKKNLYFKKINLLDRIRLLKVIRKILIKGPKKRLKTNVYDKILALFSLITRYFGINFKFILNKAPIKFIEKYKTAFYFLNTLASKKAFNNSLQLKKKLGILILHAHWNNRGDEAAIRAMIDSLKSNLPIKNIKIMILSKDIKNFPYKNIELLELFPFFNGTYSNFFSFVIDIILMFITHGNYAFSKQGKKFLKALNEVDIVIHAPGGASIGDIYGGIIWEFCYLFRLLISLFKKKPIFFYAPSLGPFLKKFRNFYRRFILKRVNAIILREAISRKYLKEQLGLNSYLTIDSALQNDISDYPLIQYDNLSEVLNVIKKEKVIGMTITDLKWHSLYMNNHLLRERIKQSFLGISKYLIKKGYLILLIPQIFGEKFEKPLLEMVWRINSKKILILPDNIDSYAQQVIISKLFCIIGMRYHPNIFAAKVHTPSIAICYEHKTKGFLEKIGRSDLMINMEDLSLNNIIKKFTYLEENYNKIKEEIKNIIPQLKVLSKKTTEIIKEKLRQIKVI